MGTTKRKKIEQGSRTLLSRGEKKELYPFRQKMGILRLLRKFPSGPRRPVKLTEGTYPTGSHPQGIDDVPKFDPICNIFLKMKITKKNKKTKKKEGNFQLFTLKKKTYIARKNKKKKKREFWHCLPLKKNGILEEKGKILCAKKKNKKTKTNIHMNFSKTNVVGKYSFNALKKA